MLTEIRVANYKSISGPLALPLRKINVFLGKNNSGKTSVARLPLLLASIFSERRITSSPVIPLVNNDLAFGSSVRELAHRQSPHLQLGLGVSFNNFLGNGNGFDVWVQPHRSFLEEGLIVTKFTSLEPEVNIEWDRVPPMFGEVKYNLRVEGFQGVMPLPEERIARMNLEHMRDSLIELIGRIDHLTSMRYRLATVFEKRDAMDTIDHGGSEAPYRMASSEKLERGVAAWYKQHLGADVAIEAEANSFRLVMYDATGEAINLARTGQGLQQILPVVTSLVAATLPLMQPRVLVVEEPELHLHPAAHGAVADLFVDAANAERAPQMFVETHSENFVLRLRRRVAEGTLSASDLNILWFDQVDGVTHIREVNVLPDGTVTNWPRGVFSEDLDEVRAITGSQR